MRAKVLANGGFILAGTGLAVYLTLLLTSLPFWMSPHLWEAGDLAANGLQVERAREGRELLGPYSQHGFHHPGPAAFYFQALLEPLLAMFPSYLARHSAAQLILTVGCITWAMWLLSRAGLAMPLAVSGVFLGAAPLIFLGGGNMLMLASVWGPLIVVGPVMLFVVAAARLLAGDLVALPAAAVGATIAYHTHLPAIPALLATGAPALVLLVRDRRRFTPSFGSRRGRILWVSAALVTAAGLAPILGEELTGQPGNLTLILRYLGDQGPGSHPWSDVGAHLGQAFTDPLVVLFPAAAEPLGSVPAALVVVVLMAAVSALQFRRVDRPWRLAIVLTWATVAVAVVSARGVPAELHTYLFYYLYGMVGLLTVFVSREFYDRCLSGYVTAAASAGIVVALCCLAGLVPWLLNHRLAEPPARDTFVQMVEKFGLRGAASIHLVRGNGDQDADLWAVLPTYALRLRRMGVAVSVDDPFVVLCGEEMRARRGATPAFTLLVTRRRPAPHMANYLQAEDWGVFLLRRGDGSPDAFQSMLPEARPAAPR